jgi:hypothetical protein
MTDLTPEKDGVIDHNMEDDVIRGATVTHAKAITFPPPPPKIAAIAAAPKKEAVPEPTAEEKGTNTQSGYIVGRWWCCAIGRGVGRTSQLYAALYCVCVGRVHWLSGYLGRGTQPAHTADGGHKCNFVDHHFGRFDANWIGIIPCYPTGSAWCLYDRY